MNTKPILTLFFILIAVHFVRAQIEVVHSLNYNNNLYDPAEYDQPVSDGTFLYGVSENNTIPNVGGGSIWRIRPDGTGYMSLHDFVYNDPSDGRMPRGALTLNGSVLYGTTHYGGTYDEGTIFRINTDGSGFTLLHSFNGTDGRHPACKLTFDGSVIYGTTTDGGSELYGTLFRINSDGTGFTNLYNFSWESGATPSGPVLIEGSMLYGTLSYAAENSYGSIYSFDLLSNIFTKLHEFVYLEGGSPYGGLLRSGDYLYGTAADGGSMYEDGGVVFKYHTTNQVYSVVHGFNLDGGSPYGSLVQQGSMLYFINEGGPYVDSRIYRLNLTNDVVLPVFNLADANLIGNQTRSWGSLCLHGGRLYGTADNGPSGKGFLFGIDTDGTDFDRVMSFNMPEQGAIPYGNLTEVAGVLYGLTHEGGKEGMGAIFSVNPDGTDFTVMHSFAESDGKYPEGSLLYHEGSLFGVTTGGGAEVYGILFKIEPNGTGFTVLHRFEFALGYRPIGKPLLFEGHLYGLTKEGGVDGFGTLYKIAPDGSGFSVVHHFNQTNGSYPTGSLIDDGIKLYGTTELGGTYSKGVIFSFEPGVAPTFTVLKHLNTLDGIHPAGSLLLTGSTLYGLASEGGTNIYSNNGTLFKIDTDGTNFNTLFSFDNYSTGAFPYGSLIQDGSSLFGMVHVGGIANAGGIFRYNLASNTFELLKKFDISNGRNPRGDLLKVGSSFYGLTSLGGLDDQGVVFKYTLPNEWTGGTNALWSEASNWSKGSVPTAAQEAYITSAPSNQPHVDLDYSNPAVCDELTILSGASVTIGAGKALTVSTMIDNKSSYPGLVIQSDATGTGSLITSSSPEATVERFLSKYDDPGDSHFHLISSPVYYQPIVPEFVTDPITAGHDFYAWDETTNEWINSKDESGEYNGTFDSYFESGKGYLVAYPDNYTKEFTSSLNSYQSDYQLEITCTHTAGMGNGWNLLGNPFPSAIDWTLIQKGSGIDNALYYWDAATQNYVYYLKLSDGSIGSGSRYIPPMQGFMVHAKLTGTRVITLNDGDRVHAAPTVFYKNGVTVPASISLSVSGNGYEDFTYIHFDSEASTAFDGQFDAFKLMSYNSRVPQIYTLSTDNKKLSINGLPGVSESINIPVSFKANTSGVYQLSADLSQFNDYSVVLSDLQTGSVQNLSADPHYSFQFNENDPTNRFKLTFGAVGIDTPLASPVSIYTYASRLHILNAGSATVEIISMAGHVVERFGVNETGTFSRQLTLSAGAYVVRVVSGNTVRTERIVIN